MFARLKPYGEYRPTGSPWIPTVPATWQARRIKTVLRERVEKGYADEPLLAATQTRGVIRKDDYELRTVTALKDLHLLKLVEVGDFVISLRSFQGGIERAHERGIISPAYTVLQPIVPEHRAYLSILFKARPFVDGLRLCVTGIREGQNIDYSRLSRDLVPSPPPSDQAAMVKYLAHANRRIDQAIAAKRKLIRLLDEQKQVIINQAITRGLDPNVSMKDSGVAWLGEIPAHWKVRRAKYVFSDVDRRSMTGDETRLSVSHLTGVTPSAEKNITMFEAASYAGHKLCNPGDLVVNTMWAWMGALGAAHMSGIVSPAYNIYRPLRPDTVSVNFVAYLLRSARYIRHFRSESTGVRPSRLRFYPDQMYAMPLVEPPYKEQLLIVAHVEEVTRGAEAAIESANREIALLREFRARLTADVVTGQVDVREIAATMPDPAFEETEFVASVDGGDEEDLNGVADEHLDIA